MSDATKAYCETIENAGPFYDAESVGNSVKLRAAVEKLMAPFRAIVDGSTVAFDPEALVKIAKEALAAPARNCDVGTAEERYARFAKVCRSFQDGFICKNECPFRGRKKGLTCCEMAWEDTPYEESEAE